MKLVHTYNIPRLNVIYAAAAFLLLISVIWMIWRDYDREWKDYQKEFRELEIERIKAKIAATQLDEAALEKLEGELEGAEADIARHKDDLASLEQERLQAQFDHYLADQGFKFTKAELDALLFKYREWKKAKDPRAVLVNRDIEKTEKALEEYRKQREEAEARLKTIDAKIASITAKRDKLQKEIARIRKERDQLERKLARIDHNFVNDWFRNQPIIDFMNPSLKINQIIVDNVYNDLSFVKAPRVDRCTTCHLAIDRKGFENAPQPFTTHPRLDLFLHASSPHPIDKIGCTICHRGRDRATSFVFAAHTPDSEEEARRWEEKYGWHEDHYWDLPMYESKNIEASCVQCHKGVIEIPQAPRVNEAMALMEWAGCHGCHKIDRFEGLRKNGPDLYKIAGKVSKAWAINWIENPKAFRPTTSMPQFFNLSNSSAPEDLVRNDVEIHAIVEFLFSVSEKPEFPDPPAGDPEKGKALFSIVGCQACHSVEPRKAKDFRQHFRMNFGPNLASVGSKLTPGWTYQWIRDPKSIFPNTRMPNLRLSETEAADITAYLMTLKLDRPLPPPPTIRDTDRDKVVLDYLTGQMPIKEAKAKLASMTVEEKDRYLGRRAILHYGCTGCHNIQGLETTQRIGVELNDIGAKRIALLDFGFVDTEHTLKNWLVNKLMNPRIWDTGRLEHLAPRDRLKMPFFGFSREQAETIVTFLLGLSKTKLVADSAMKHLSPRERAIEEGFEIVKRKNCMGCHVIEGEGGDIRALIPDPGLYPPILTGEGKKVQPDWLFGFLKRPFPIRPWLKTRMPTFGFTDDEATKLVHYFNALEKEPYPFEFYDRTQVAQADVEEGRAIFEGYKCLKCHQFGTDTHGRAPADLAPNLQMAHERLKPDWIVEWLLDPQKILPGTRMPQFWYLDEDADPEDVEDALTQIRKVRDYLMTLGSQQAPETAMRQ